MRVFKRVSVYAFCCVFGLSGCVTSSPMTVSSGSTFGIGPELSSLLKPDREAVIDESKPRLDIVIPVFDPGLPEEKKPTKKVESTREEVDEKEGVWQAESFSGDDETVWPELRRAEANRFAYKLKSALEETGAFGAVRVVPDGTATGDLYVMGRIGESDGEDVEIDVEVVDISGQRWFDWGFDHEVDASFHKNIRNEGKDPYDPLFADVANQIALQVEDRTSEDLTELQRITDLRFGANLADEAFIDHMKIEGGQVDLVSYPSDDDPMLRGTKAIRVRDQLFVDGLQQNYQSFSKRMEDSYLIWQEQSLLEIEAERDAKVKAAGQAALGVAFIALGVLAVAAGARSDNLNVQSLGASAGVVGAAGGVAALANSFQTSKEAEVHRNALNELGESIDVDLAPQVVEFEEKTVSLTGDAKEQFAQWRDFLQQIYEEERTPKEKL